MSYPPLIYPLSTPYPSLILRSSFAEGSLGRIMNYELTNRKNNH
ncbi:hypothetical protein HMPREF9075_02346 [Capnocytophaga sp. oral taxon 332 str. F0381]|nr:hypothetical protein HMPREF9075_02346 [Capnocytophaga sp. oral taxon 332 str. F0381]